MKTTLLLFILTFSMSVYAQNNPVRPFPHNPKSKVFHTSPVKMRDADMKESKLHPDRDFAKEMERQTRELFTDIQVYDSIYIWQWDSFATKWQLIRKEINFLYNTDGLPTSFIYQKLDAGTWVNLFQYNITYDANGNELSFIYKKWNGTFFANVFQDVFTYDANNNQTSDIFQVWNGTAWDNSFGYIYMYDGNNNLISQLEQSWNGTSWDNYDLYTYTYDANKNRLSEIYQSWNDVDLIWINSSRNLYTYDSNNNLITDEFQYWDESIVGWDPYELNTYSYNASNNPVNQLTQYWNVTQWRNGANLIYTYNASEDLTNTLSQTWNVSNWDNSARTTNTYNGNHQLIRSLYENWDGSSWISSTLSFNTYGENDFLESYSNRTFNVDGSIVTEGDSTFNFFHTITGTHEVTNDDMSISLSPNPNNGQFTISSKDALQSINVFNMLGERIYSIDQLKGQTSADIDLTGYGKGIYIVTMADGKKTYSRKVVIQ